MKTSWSRASSRPRIGGSGPRHSWSDSSERAGFSASQPRRSPTGRTGSGRHPGRRRDRAAQHGGAAHPERQDGLDRPARLRRRARAQQPADLDRRTDRAPAGARAEPRVSARALAGDPRAGGASGANREEPADLRAKGRSRKGCRGSERRRRANVSAHHVRAPASRHRAGVRTQSPSRSSCWATATSFSRCCSIS